MDTNGFFGIYEDFDEISDKVTEVGSYDIKDWVNKQVLRLKDINDEIDIIRERNDLLIDNVKPGDRILDIGGSLGTSWISIKDVDNIKYTVVENDMIAEAGKKFVPEIEFLKEIPSIQISTHYNIIYIRTSLQYMADWKRTLLDLSNCEHEAGDLALFKHTSVGDFPTFATIQNWYGHKIPYWFINFEDFNNWMYAYQWELVEKKECESFKKSKPHWDSIQQFPEEYRIDKTLDLKYEFRD